jgi:hypothetical protein
MRTLLLSASLALALQTLALSAADAPRARLRISAGDHERAHAVVAVPWSHGVGPWQLRAPDGAVLPLQVSGETAWFILPRLAKDASQTFTLEPRNESQTPAIRANRTDSKLALRQGDKPVLEYFAGPGELPRADIPAIYRRGGYLHPIRTPAGRAITDDYPPNHIHHHGVWTAWTRTRFENRAPDFWNMGEGKARVDFDRLDDIESGPVFAAFTTRHVFTDLLANPPKPALEETWIVRAFALKPDASAFAFDLEIEQRAAQQEPLFLPAYYYGGVGFRGRWEWNGPANMRYLDSNGVTNRVAANETRARWFWMGGMVDGHLAGMAVLGSPSNFRAPQPLRVHPHEPFICWAPSQLGDWSIRPGEPFASRYRVIPLDGEPSPAELDRLWNDFATPPAVEFLPGE